MKKKILTTHTPALPDNICGQNMFSWGTVQGGRGFGALHRSYHFHQTLNTTGLLGLVPVFNMTFSLPLCFELVYTTILQDCGFH